MKKKRGGGQRLIIADCDMRELSPRFVTRRLECIIAASSAAREFESPMCAIQLLKKKRKKKPFSSYLECNKGAIDLVQQLSGWARAPTGRIYTYTTNLYVAYSVVQR